MTGVEMNNAGKITKDKDTKPPLVEEAAAKKADNKEEKKEGDK